MTAERARMDILHQVYRHAPVHTDHVPYSRQRRQKLQYMRAWLGDRTSYTSRLRQAYADAYVLRTMRPVINDGELIVGLPDHSPLTEEEQQEYSELEKAMQAAPRIGGLMGHKALDYPKLLRLGVEGLLEEIRTLRSALDPDAPETVEKDEFYEGCEAELTALIDLQTRYAAYARQLAGQAQEPRRSELERIAQVLDRVPAKPARTLHEALQSMHFYQFALWDLYYFGRVDQYLLPYYEADLAAGHLTEAEAQELIDCFAKIPEGYIVWESSTGVLVGGRDRSGKAVENALTWKFLNTIERTHTAVFKVGLAATGETSDDLLRYAMRLNAMGCTEPAIFNDAVITKALMDAGFEEGDAHWYSNTGCVEITPIGKSGIWVVSPYHNLALMLLEAMERDCSSLDELIGQLAEILRREVRRGSLQQNRYMMERQRVGGEVLRVSCLVDDCLKRGRAVDQGGAVYNHTQPNFLGMANVTDSLVALDHLVFRSGEYTLAQIRSILDANFEGHEALRQRIVNKIPHFGMDDKETNAMCRRLGDLIEQTCAGMRNYRGLRLIPGAFSYLEHARHGKRTPATPDGRLAAYPLASGSSPVQGRETKGPTAAMLSATCWDHSCFWGGIAVNMRFTPNQLSDEAQQNMLAFIKVFLERGGFQMQFNAVSSEQLHKAQQHPEEYEDLMVRVGGFSAYFTRLTPEMQQEIIDRNEHTV